MPLSRRPLPFDHPEWIFELKYDGFRALAVIQNGRTQLISRNGHPFSFDLRVPLHAGKTVLDGEIVCVDEQGKPQFRDLLFHRGEPCFLHYNHERPHSSLADRTPAAFAELHRQVEKRLVHRWRVLQSLFMESLECAKPA